MMDIEMPKDESRGSWSSSPGMKGSLTADAKNGDTCRRVSARSS